MAISEKKHNTSPLDFCIDDCYRVVEIYQDGQKRAVSQSIDMEEMLHQFRLALGAYNIAHHQDSAPTITQLRKQHTDIRNKAQNLLIDLKEKTDTHFLNSLACTMANTKSPITIDDEEYKKLITSIYGELESLGKSLKWLTDNLDPCATEKFDYLHTKLNPKARKSAENSFISDLAMILIKHLTEGGYAYDSHRDGYQNKYHGWKIDCIEYLLGRVNTGREKSQIFAVLSDSKGKKKENNTSE